MADEQETPLEVPSPSGQKPIRFEMTAAKPTETTPGSVDWRKELRRRLEERSLREGKVDPETDEEEIAESGQPPPSEDAEEDLFRYKMRPVPLRPSLSRPELPSRPRERFQKRKDLTDILSVPTEKPLIRFAQSLDDSPAVGSRQKTFELQPTSTPPPFRLEEAAEEEVTRRVDKETVSREILFSRFLCGIIDLTFPILIGLGFSLMASQLLEFDIFSTESLYWVGGFSFALFLFNSFYFLIASGQTPGMSLTELKLVDEDSDSVPTLPVLLFRIALFLPSVVSVVGLAWALVDPLRRCVHDVLSGTRVERS